MSETDLNGILRWAAGADIDVSDIHSVETDRMLKLISRHKLQVRFLARAKAECPRWYTRALSIPLWQTWRAVQAKTRRQIAALCEITAALPAHAGPPILIKGFTAYALTSNESALRPSGDIDIFFPDKDEAAAVLRHLGYTDLSASCVDHEAFKMERGGVLLEIHRYFPVRAYPADLDISSPEAARRGWVAQTSEAVHMTSQIEYTNLRDHAVQVMDLNGASYWVADSPMAALTLCTHIFRDYIERCGVQLTTPIPLAEIADLHDLTRLPKFDAPQFLDLAQKFGAQHSVELAGQMLESCYGHNTLPRHKPTSLFHQRRVFPQCLNWAIGIWAVPSSVKSLPTRRMSEALDGLGGANTIVVQESVTTVHAAGGADGESVSNALVRKKAGKSLPLQFSVTLSAEALGFNVHLPLLPAESTDIIKFNFGDGNDCYWRCWGVEAVPEHHYGSLRGEASVTVQEDDYTLRLSLPWPHLAAAALLGDEVLLTLEVERWPDIISTLVPMRIVPL